MESQHSQAEFNEHDKNPMISQTNKVAESFERRGPGDKKSERRLNMKFDIETIKHYFAKVDNPEALVSDDEDFHNPAHF